MSFPYDLVDEQLSHNGFSPVQILDDAGMCSGTVYMRDPVEILQTQLYLPNTESTLYSPTTKKDSEGNELFSHPLETKKSEASSRAGVDFRPAVAFKFRGAAPARPEAFVLRSETTFDSDACPRRSFQA